MWNELRIASMDVCKEYIAMMSPAECLIICNFNDIANVDNNVLHHWCDDRYIKLLLYIRRSCIATVS